MQDFSGSGQMTAHGYQGHLKRGDTLNEDLDQMTEKEREHYQEGLGRSLSSQQGSWGNRSGTEVERQK